MSDDLSLKDKLAKAKAALMPHAATSAAARRNRAREQKAAVLGNVRRRDPTRSTSVISFRGSDELKERLARRCEAARHEGERFNEWMERVLLEALDREERGTR
jgi:hypothetical protein